VHPRPYEQFSTVIFPENSVHKMAKISCFPTIGVHRILQGGSSQGVDHEFSEKGVETKCEISVSLQF